MLTPKEETVLDMHLEQALTKLGQEFETLNLTFHRFTAGKPGDVISYWPGKENEDVMVCVFKGKNINEPFHRQDFFFLNFAYRQGYEALSAEHNNLIRILENECYIGQPYSGYALRGKSDKEIVIIGVLIRKKAFFKEYLSVIAKDASLFHFFLSPQKDKFSEEFIHLSFSGNYPVRRILELMVMEYAMRSTDTQNILKPLLLALFMHITRRYRETATQSKTMTVDEKILQYINENTHDVTLKDIASHFSYHPNYISALLHQKTGKTFSKIILEKRMKKAKILLEETTLPIEEIASMLGYSNSSNFYKTFKSYFHSSPRALNQQSNIYKETCGQLSKRSS